MKKIVAAKGIFRRGGKVLALSPPPPPLPSRLLAAFSNLHVILELFMVTEIVQLAPPTSACLYRGQKWLPTLFSRVSTNKKMLNPGIPTIKKFLTLYKFLSTNSAFSEDEATT